MPMLTLRGRYALAAMDLLKGMAQHPEKAGEGEDDRGDGADIGRAPGPWGM
jgi:hypothetical protein